MITHFRCNLLLQDIILFPVVLGIDFLYTHGGIISFPTNQLYLTTSPPTPADQPINTNHIYNAYTLPTHAPTPHHPHTRITVPSNHTYHVINTAPVIIPARTNTIMTIPCTLPHSGNYLFEPSARNFADHPVHCTPVIINAAMTTYLSTSLIIVTVTLLYPNTLMSEPWKKSKNHIEIAYLPMLPQNRLVKTYYPNVLPTVTCCPANANRCILSLKKTQVSSDPVLLISPVPHLYNITSTLVMLNPSSKDSTSSNILNWMLTSKLTLSKQDRHCIWRIPIICKVPTPPS